MIGGRKSIIKHGGRAGAPGFLSMGGDCAESCSTQGRQRSFGGERNWTPRKKKRTGYDVTENAERDVWGSRYERKGGNNSKEKNRGIDHPPSAGGPLSALSTHRRAAQLPLEKKKGWRGMKDHLLLEGAYTQLLWHGKGTPPPPERKFRRRWGNPSRARNFDGKNNRSQVFLRGGGGKESFQRRVQKELKARGLPSSLRNS